MIKAKFLYIKYLKEKEEEFVENRQYDIGAYIKCILQKKISEWVRYIRNDHKSSLIFYIVCEMFLLVSEKYL